MRKGAVRSVLPLRTSHSLYAFYMVRPAHPCQQKSNLLYLAFGYNSPRGANAPKKGAPYFLQFPNKSTGRRKSPEGTSEEGRVPIGTPRLRGTARAQHEKKARALCALYTLAFC